MMSVISISLHDLFLSSYKMYAQTLGTRFGTRSQKPDKDAQLYLSVMPHGTGPPQKMGLQIFYFTFMSKTEKKIWRLKLIFKWETHL